MSNTFYLILVYWRLRLYIPIFLSHCLDLYLALNRIVACYLCLSSLAEYLTSHFGKIWFCWYPLLVLLLCHLGATEMKLRSRSWRRGLSTGKCLSSSVFLWHLLRSSCPTLTSCATLQWFSMFWKQEVLFHWSTLSLPFSGLCLVHQDQAKHSGFLLLLTLRCVSHVKYWSILFCDGMWQYLLSCGLL